MHVLVFMTRVMHNGMRCCGHARHTRARTQNHSAPRNTQWPRPELGERNPLGKTKTPYSGISLFWGQVRVRGVFVPGILNRVIRLKPLFRYCLFQGIYGEE